MARLSDNIVEAFAAGKRGSLEEIGPALKRLRSMSGFTQVELAAVLGVRQSSISKIETGGDVNLRSIRKYVEALGASLRIDATFPTDTPLAQNIRQAFDVEYGDDDQLVLPILDDDKFKAHRDVVLSIKPKYSSKILQGKKTVELRRRFPVSAPEGAVAYVYSTSPQSALVGLADIAEVRKLPVAEIWSNFRKCAHIRRADFDSYFSGLDFGYAILLENVRTLARPIRLEELRHRFGFEPPQSFRYAKQELREALRDGSAVVSN